MRPILLTIGSLQIPSWHVFYAIGAIVAFYALIRSNRSLDAPIPERILSTLFVVTYISGFLGSRLLSIIIEQPEIDGLTHIVSAMFSFGPMTFFGGAISAFVVGIIFVFLRKLSLLRILDLSIPSGFIGLFFGRIGCFLNGCCYGVPIRQNFRLGIQQSILEITRVPVQLIESIFAGLFGVVLIIALSSKRWKAGDIGFLGIFGYSAFRFVIEFYRDDYRGWVLQNLLSTSQFISLVAAVIVTIAWPLIRFKKS